MLRSWPRPNRRAGPVVVRRGEHGLDPPRSVAQGESFESNAMHGRVGHAEIQLPARTERNPVTDQCYGDRSGQLEDPFGHLWWVVPTRRTSRPTRCSSASRPCSPGRSRPAGMYGQGGVVEVTGRYHQPACACAAHDSAAG